MLADNEPSHHADPMNSYCLFWTLLEVVPALTVEDDFCRGCTNEPHVSGLCYDFFSVFSVDKSVSLAAGVYKCTREFGLSFLNN